MKLADLEATFIKITSFRADGDVATIQEGVSFADADGISFLCPKCFATNNGNVGTHLVWCWFAERVGAEVFPKPGRWHPSGTGLDDLTFVGPGSVSILLQHPNGCGWHGFIRNGEATLS